MMIALMLSSPYATPLPRHYFDAASDVGHHAAFVAADMPLRRYTPLFYAIYLIISDYFASYGCRRHIRFAARIVSYATILLLPY